MLKEMCPEHRLVQAGSNPGAVVCALKRIMQPDERKFSCIAANYKNTMYKTTMYVQIDKKCHEVTCFFPSVHRSTLM